jgi:Protein of unknown function (DUF2939)
MPGPRNTKSESHRARNFWPIVAIAVMLAIFAGTYVLSPFVFLRSLSDAARTGNSDALAAEVDFPSVRDGLKSQLGIFLARRALGRTPRRHYSLTDIALLIAPASRDRIIDALVTPENLVILLQRPKQQFGDSSLRPSLLRGQFSWVDMDHVRMRYTSAAHPELALTIILERQGIFGWKVTGVHLPLDQMARMTGA